MSLTEYGRVIREVRESLQKSLRQMADDIGFSPTYLSAVEMGERTVTDDFINKVVGFLRKNGVKTKEISRLCAAADRSRRSIDVSELDGDGKTAVAAFARKWADLDVSARARFLKDLNKT